MEHINDPHYERILVVEDHPESAELLQMILEDAGHEVRCVKTGLDALRVFAPPLMDEISEFHPDLILLDLRLPDMNGVDVVKELRKSQPAIPPVVFLSADSPQILKMAAASVGATSVRKPFEFDDLFTAIEGALDKTERS
jgi:two-component system OmpR family response regulator